MKKNTSSNTEKKLLFSARSHHDHQYIHPKWSCVHTYTNIQRIKHEKNKTAKKKYRRSNRKVDDMREARDQLKYDA